MEQKYKILVVDDEQDLLEILKFNLETEGYEVETAASAEEALTLDIGSFNLMLLDVMMGGMSGFAMARKLKDNPATAAIPIIFLTARDTENDTLTGFSLGADDYISKPFSIREVLVRVRITLACTECKQRNYNTTKEKKNHPERLETRKYCRFCRKHTVHKETK